MLEKARKKQLIGPHHVSGGGLWINTSDYQSRDRKPLKGKTLAIYTDKSGYSIHIVGGVPAKDKATVMGQVRYGTMYITSSKGETLQGGFWMCWPEKEWYLTDRQFSNLPWEERAGLEAHQQATAYKPLKEQFAIRKKNVL